MRITWEKYKEIITIGIYLLFMVILFEFIIFPLNDSIKNKKKYAEEELISRSVYEKRLKDTPQFKEKIDSIVSLREKLNVLVGSDSAIPLIESIEGLALETSNDISLEIIEDRSKKKEETKKSGTAEKEDKSIKANLPSKEYILIRINLEGDFNTVLNFIEKIEKLKYFSDITSIKISKKEETIQADSSKINRQTNFIQSGTITNIENPVNVNENKFENPITATMEVAFYLEKK